MKPFLCCFGLIAVLFSCKTGEPELAINNVWSRPALAATDSSGRMNHTGVVYFEVTNRGASADRLLRVRSDVAERTEIHLSRVDKGVMKMEHLHDGVEIPAGGSLQFKPGSYHIMLIGLKRSLEAGQQFDVVLGFESGERTIQSEVKAQ